MQLIDEKQRFPLVFACVLVALVVATAYVVTHLVNPAPGRANLLYWYMARSSGFTAYGLLSLTVLLGVSSSSGLWDKLKMRRLSTQMHQYTALLVLPFLFFHLWGLHLDTSVPFPWRSIALPFINTYRPLSTGLGVLVLYGWILLVGTSYFREKIGVKVWRVIHIGAFPMFIFATLHGLLTGTDTGTKWSTLVYLIPFVLFIILVVTRILSNKPGRRTRAVA